MVGMAKEHKGDKRHFATSAVKMEVVAGCLASGFTIKDAAAAAKCSGNAIYKWLGQEVFQAVLAKARARVEVELFGRMRREQAKILDNPSDDPKVLQVKAMIANELQRTHARLEALQIQAKGGPSRTLNVFVRGDMQEGPVKALPAVVTIESNGGSEVGSEDSGDGDGPADNH